MYILKQKLFVQLVKSFTLLLMFILPSIASAVDDATVEAIDLKATTANAKAESGSANSFSRVICSYIIAS